MKIFCSLNAVSKDQVKLKKIKRYFVNFYKKTCSFVIIKTNINFKLKITMILFRKYAKVIASTVLISVCLFAGQAYSQKNVAAILQSTSDDATKITGAYMKPLGDALGVYMNSGWYNTGAPHSLLGFDVTCTFNTMLVPKLNKTYNIAGLNLSNMKFATGKTAPTIFGEDKEGPTGDVIITRAYPPIVASDTVHYSLPAGTGISMMVMPTFQIGLGLMKNTDITFRYVPKVETPGSKITGKVSLWGVGLRHDLLQYLPGGKLIPLSLSIMGAYSQMNFGADFPNALNPPNGVTYENGTMPVASTYADQALNVNVKAWNVNAIISKKILMVTVYVSGGYNSSKAEYALNGTYSIPNVYFDGVHAPKPIVVDKKDPLTVTDKKLSYFKGNAGLRLNIAIITLHADYTFGKYQTISGGLGISFR